MKGMARESVNVARLATLFISKTVKSGDTMGGGFCKL